DVLTGRDGDLELVLGREPKLVDGVHVLRVRDRNQKLVAVDRIRNRADALEDVEGDELGRLRGDAVLDDVDEREIVAEGERTGNARSHRVALLDERLRERARPRTVTQESDPGPRQD